MEVDEQLRPLEVTRSDTNIVLGTGMVELGKTPINQP